MRGMKKKGELYLGPGEESYMNFLKTTNCILSIDVIRGPADQERPCLLRWYGLRSEPCTVGGASVGPVA